MPPAPAIKAHIANIKHFFISSRKFVLGALILSFIGMILSFLALFAGNVVPDSSTGFMAYAPVIRVCPSLPSSLVSYLFLSFPTTSLLLSANRSSTTPPSSPRRRAGKSWKKESKQASTFSPSASAPPTRNRYAP